MSDDDDHPVPVTIRPAVPVDPNKVAQAMDLPSRKAVIPDPRDAYPVESEKLPDDDIKRLNALRAENMRKKRMGRPPGSKNKPKLGKGRTPGDVARPRRDRHETGKTAPNRPLEMKSRLSAVLHITTQLARPELVLFHDIMLRLEKTPRGARKRIIAALASVYP
jgi:hypothetical protein